MLWQRETQELLRQPEFRDLKNLTIETNCTQPFKAGFDKFLHGLTSGDYTKDPVHITWSTSPKLSISGEDPARAIRPDVARQYADIPNSHLYFKFVVQDEQDLAEVDDARKKYSAAGVDADIYLMPVGATLEGQAKTSRQVADICLQYGYKYSPRLHVDLFGNKWGTESKKKEKKSKSEEPWVKVIKLHVQPENPKNGFFELDWNDEFVNMLKQSGYQGESQEEVVDRWFQTLCRTVGNEQGIDVTGAGYVQINRRNDGKTEVS
jgi:organic radical activating enzyme